MLVLCRRRAGVSKCFSPLFCFSSRAIESICIIVLEFHNLIRFHLLFLFFPNFKEIFYLKVFHSLPLRDDFVTFSLQHQDLGSWFLYC